MSIEEIVLEAEERMEKSIALLTDQLRGVRTGRANVGLVDSIRVEYYGSPTPLKQLANLSTPEPQQILIRPFDQTAVGDIVKAIQASDLGLTPNSDNKVIRLNVPSLSVEQRKKLVARVEGPRRGGPRLDPQHPPRRQQAGRQGADRQGPDRGRPRALQGRDPVADQAVRGEGQRHGREEVGGDPRGLRFKATRSATPAISRPMLITTLTWKNATLTRVRSSGRTIACS